MKRIFSNLFTKYKRNMDITSANFKERLPQIEEAIDTASFISFDGEFTGLNAYRGISPFDLPHERYDKLQESARQFLLVQFGLCTFHYNPTDDSYSHQAFNVYVWPRPCSRTAPDPRFLCQTSSIDFLTKQNFDFNKLFKEGVSYLRPAELSKLKESLVERQENRRTSQAFTPDQNIPVPQDQEEFLSGVMESIENFVKSENQTMDLESKMNGFQRRLVYQTAREKFSQLSLSSVNRTGGDRVICVVKADEEQQQQFAHLKEKAEHSEVEEAFGFSRVVQKITESGKLLIGHNMILDVAHTLNQFCGPLPESYTDFKVMTSAVLPNLLDTKLMANTTPFKQEIHNSALEELFKIVSTSPYSVPYCPPKTPGSGYIIGQGDKFHEAGYDALITGLCFIAMSNRLGQHCSQGEKGKDGRVLPDSPLIQPFLNKLYLMRINDIPYINLAGDDLVPDRGHVFHITFPKEWKSSDIIHLFTQFGYVFISWLDDSSAFVSLKEKELAGTVLSVLQTSSVYRLQTYASYQKSKSVPSTGIIPTLEKRITVSNVNVDNVEDQPKKRPLSPEQNNLKRHKSVTEELETEKCKTFEEPDWD